METIVTHVAAQNNANDAQVYAKPVSFPSIVCILIAVNTTRGITGISGEAKSLFLIFFPDVILAFSW